MAMQIDKEGRDQLVARGHRMLFRKRDEGNLGSIRLDSRPSGAIVALCAPAAPGGIEPSHDLWITRSNLYGRPHSRTGRGRKSLTMSQPRPRNRKRKENDGVVTRQTVGVLPKDFFYRSMMRRAADFASEIQPHATPILCGELP